MQTAQVIITEIRAINYINYTLFSTVLISLYISFLNLPSIFTFLEEKYKYWLILTRCELTVSQSQGWGLPLLWQHLAYLISGFTGTDILTLLTVTIQYNTLQYNSLWHGSSPTCLARSTWYSTLVGCTRTRHIQAMHDRLQVSARNGTDISVGDVPAELVGSWSSSFAFC